MCGMRRAWRSGVCAKGCLHRPAPPWPWPLHRARRVMAGFKKGAFSVAGKAGVDVVPVTLLGTGDLMPSGEEVGVRPPHGGVRWLTRAASMPDGAALAMVHGVTSRGCQPWQPLGGAPGRGVGPSSRRPRDPCCSPHAQGVLRPGAVKIVVHAPIPTKGRDMGQVRAFCSRSITGGAEHALV